jgi:predicted TPR repeat methyltransferase
MGGVDLSEKMIDKAREREGGVYQELVVGDLVPFLTAGNGSEGEGTAAAQLYDLVLAADTLPYIGDLDPLMEALQVLWGNLVLRVVLCYLSLEAKRYNVAYLDKL